jgi:hypothetical protein
VARWEEPSEFPDGGASSASVIPLPTTSLSALMRRYRDQAHAEIGPAGYSSADFDPETEDTIHIDLGTVGWWLFGFCAGGLTGLAAAVWWISL